MMEYAIGGTFLIIVAMFVFLYFYEKSKKRTRNEILTILRESKDVMSVPDIVYVVEQAGIIIDNDDAYRFLDSLCESKEVRCYAEPQFEGGTVKFHGRYAIDTIANHNR